MDGDPTFTHAIQGYYIFCCSSHEDPSTEYILQQVTPDMNLLRMSYHSTSNLAYLVFAQLKEVDAFLGEIKDNPDITLMTKVEW